MTIEKRWEATTAQAEKAMAMFEGDDWRRCRAPDECSELLEGMRETLTVAVGPLVEELEAGIEAGRRAARTCRELMDAMLEIEHVLDDRQVVPGELPVPRRVEALADLCDEAADFHDEAQEQLARAHAAIRWFATVRAVITSGMLKADGGRGILLNILAVAHAASEIWLSGEPVTARAIADTLGWYADYSELAVRDYLRPLQTGPHPPLVNEDGTPNIEVR